MKRTVIAEAILDDAIAAPVTPAPAPRAKRAELVEPQWMVDYRAHNDRLAAATELLSHAWEPRERVALLRRVRTIAVGCPNKEAILAALDEIIDATGYTPDKL